MNPNSLLVRWADGFVVVDDDAAIAAAGGAVRRAFYSIPDVQTAEAAEVYGTQELARLQGGESIVAEPVVTVGDATAPYAGWFVGDSIPVTQFDGSGTDTVEVVGITATEDEFGVVSVTPELQTPLQVRAERMATKLRRAQPGVTSNVATISRGMDRNNRGGEVGTEGAGMGVRRATVGQVAADEVPPSGAGNVLGSHSHGSGVNFDRVADPEERHPGVGVLAEQRVGVVLGSVPCGRETHRVLDRQRGVHRVRRGGVRRDGGWHRSENVVVPVAGRSV